MKDKLFYVICFSFATGVLWRSFFVPNLSFALPALVAATSAIVTFNIYDKKSLGVLLFTTVLTFSFGAFWFGIQDISPPTFLENKVGQKIHLSGMIVEEPSPGAKSTQIVIETKVEGIKTNILLFADRNSPYVYGDTIEVSGKVAKPDNFMTDQGKKFDYINYLKNDNILYVMSYPTITKISEGGGNFIKRALFFIRRKFDTAINGAIPNPESALARGLILGERSSFDDTLRQAFIATGLIHIVAVSGYNVTIIAEWVRKLLGFLPLIFANILGIFSVIAFVILSGGTQTAIRAGSMAVLALFATSIGRKYNVGRALICTGVVMVFLSPRILAFDVSFQLSFLATIAVIYLAPRLEQYFVWIKWKSIRDVITITIAAYVFVFPFVLYKMGNLSLIALPANFAVLPLIPLTMLASFVTGTAGLLWSAPAIFLGKVAYLFLHYELSAIAFFAGLPFSSISIPNFPLILTLLLYGCFCFFLFVRKRKPFVTVPK